MLHEELDAWCATLDRVTYVRMPADGLWTPQMLHDYNLYKEANSLQAGAKKAWQNAGGIPGTFNSYHDEQLLHLVRLAIEWMEIAIL